MKEKGFWAEIVSTGGLGALLFFVFDLKDIGQVTWIIGALHVYHRFSLFAYIRTALNPVQSALHELEVRDAGLKSYLELRQRVIGEQSLRDAVDLFYQPSESELDWHKNSALDEVNRNLISIVQSKRSPTMYTSEYYRWLLPKIEETLSGSEIWAISRMMDCEWDESPEEEEFLRLNVEAARRGVKVTRLFICEASTWAQAKQSVRPIRTQLNEPKLDVYFGDVKLIRRRDAAILPAIGDGLIAFDDRVMLVDEHSDDGSARGYVSANRPDIARARERFSSLRNMCTKVGRGKAA